MLTLSSTAAVDWVVCPKRRPDAAVRLFCLPYAGVGPSVFRDWTALLPAAIEAWLVELPGRERTWRATPLTRVRDIVGPLADQVAQQADRPVALFGHSVGGLLAFEVVRELRRRGVSVSHLFVSARRAPGLPERLAPLHQLTDSEFVTAVRQRYEGIPEQVWRDADLMRLLLPALRADFEVLETHVHEPGDPLGCPITAFGGLADDTVSMAEVESWRQHTSAAFALHMVPASHLYVKEQARGLTQAIGDALVTGATDATVGTAASADAQREEAR